MHYNIIKKETYIINLKYLFLFRINIFIRLINYFNNFNINDFNNVLKYFLFYIFF
jgi:hypothetical protein